jgi:NADH-quinone oxidoreductase subunit E
MSINKHNVHPTGPKAARPAGETLFRAMVDILTRSPPPAATQPEAAGDGRPMTSAEQADLEALLQAQPPEPRRLLPLLQAIQASFRHLPELSLTAVSERLGLPPARVFAVANFYKALSLTPKGERVFTVCQGTACHLRGSPGLVKALEAALGASLGGVSPDGRDGLESVNCLGACALAPVVTVDGLVHGRLDPKAAAALAMEGGRR